MKRTSIWFLGVLSLSCAHVEELTVDEHRNEAALHTEKARQETEKFDPAATMRAAPRTTTLVPGDVPFEPYNPSQAHLQAADRELAKANAHLAAAETLVSFEDKACAGLSPGERSSCPLFASSVSKVSWLEGGFKLTFIRPADAAPTLRRLSCHLAYAASSGFDQPSCPLFIKGTSIDKAGEDAIAFTGNSGEVTQALRVQARRIFSGAPAL